MPPTETTTKADGSGIGTLDVDLEPSSRRLDAVTEESTSEDDVQAHQTPMDVDSTREPSSADPGSTAGSDARSISHDFEAERSSGRRFRWIISVWTSSKMEAAGSGLDETVFFSIASIVAMSFKTFYIPGDCHQRSKGSRRWSSATRLLTRVAKKNRNMDGCWASPTQVSAEAKKLRRRAGNTLLCESKA